MPLAPREAVARQLPPQAVILDVDGTLVDSNDAHARSWVQMLAEGGQYVSYDRVRHMIGMGGDKLLPLLTGIGEDTEAGREMSSRRAEIFTRQFLPHLRAFPGARALVERIRGAGLRVVVGSSAGRDMLGDLLDIADVGDLVQDSTSKDDADRSKPDPDIVRAALVRAGAPPEHVVVIGDTPYDIEAAARAGVGSIALRCGGGWSEQDLAGALAVFDDPLDLLLHFDDSPLAPTQSRPEPLH